MTLWAASSSRGSGKLHKRIVPRLPSYVWGHYTAPAPSRAIGSTLQRFAPRPASIGISIPRCYPQCPIRLDPAPLRWPEARTPPPPHPHPAHRDTSILVARTLQRSTSNLGPSRYPSSRLRRPSPITAMSAILPVPRGPAMPTALNRESLCQGMDGGSTITRGPMPVVKEAEGIGDEFERR